MKSLKKNISPTSCSSLIYHHRWIHNGGKQTLLSYGVIKIDKQDGKLVCTKDDEKFKELMEHFSWLKNLPMYIELENKKKMENK